MKFTRHFKRTFYPTMCKLQLLDYKEVKPVRETLHSRN